MQTLKSHEYWMQKALTEAEKGLFSTAPNPRVGCVIVKNNQNIGSGYHAQAGMPHAEIYALQAAGTEAAGATAYVTLEPCAHYGRTPPCAEALIQAGIKRVVIACLDPNPQVSGKGVALLQSADIEVINHICEAQALLLNRPFFHRMSTGKPWVTLKLACSMDGKTALANGESQWITSQAARDDVHQQRAQADVIMAGTGSVIHDNAKLNARIQTSLLMKPALRVVIDSELKTPAAAALFSIPTPVLIATTMSAHPKYPYDENIEIHRFDAINGKVNLRSLINYLGCQQYNHVFVEAGASLAGVMLSENLVDEILLYQNPSFLGNTARDLVMLSPLNSLSDRMRFKIVESKIIGDNCRFSLIRK